MLHGPALPVRRPFHTGLYPAESRQPNTHTLPFLPFTIRTASGFSVIGFRPGIHVIQVILPDA